MKTINGKKITLPLMKNCRVDYKERGGVKFSVLIDFMNDDNILYYVSGVKQLRDLYGDFKFSAKSELPIDNSHHFLFSVHKIDNVLYSN